MKEVITIHIGQAGVQIGDACWKLFCLEHDIDPSGKMPTNQVFEDDSFQTFFSETNKGKYNARSLFVDLEPKVIDEIRTGSYRQLFHPNNLISGKESAASNFNRGYWSVGKSLVDTCLHEIRKLVENCEGFQGFIITHSLGGGTGSGFGSLLCERLSVEYGKKSKHAFTIFPSPKLSTSVVEPYNTVLSAHFLLEHIDLVTAFGNESLYNICSKYLDVEAPSYKNINRLIAQTMSSYTSSLRFDGSLNYDLNDIESNMVPYPRIHFLHSSYAPLISVDKAYHEQPSIYQITKSSFDPSLMMIDVNPKERVYMSCCMMYRGDAPLLEVNHAISEVKKRKNVRFMDFTPSAFKVGINYQPTTVIPGGDIARSMRSLYMMANSTAIADVFERINYKFDLMYAKRAFVHWYAGEGGESGQFVEAREDLAALEKDYWPREGIGIVTYEDEEYYDDAFY